MPKEDQAHYEAEQTRLRKLLAEALTETEMKVVNDLVEVEVQLEVYANL